jgi:hypothetical protein
LQEAATAKSRCAFWTAKNKRARQLAPRPCFLVPLFPVF